MPLQNIYTPEDPGRRSGQQRSKKL